MEGFKFNQTEGVDLKKQLMEAAAKSFEDFKTNKESILAAEEADEALGDDASEDEIFASSDRITNISGHNAEQKITTLLNDGITLEEMGLNKDEVVEAFGEDILEYIK